MALVIDVEEFCVFKAQEAKLANGHSAKRCPQCQALRRVVIEVNNKTLDMIIEVFGHCKPGTVLPASDIARQIQGLKTVQ